MFIDLAKIKVQAGKGGNGVVAWRREIYIDKGGPSGGDGGKGGDITLVGEQQLNTLHQFRFNQLIKAGDGENGGKQRKHGKSAEDKMVKVPIGTVVKIDGHEIADITKHGQEFILAHGGDGGFGNAHFKSSTRQAPRVAELGERGEYKEVSLELKLLADVGLVGLPNAGKSTFLSVVTNAKPQIADYPFTTLSPNLGVHDIGSDSLLIADVPGLIEGASEGKGLGHDFLRHIERTAVLIHLVDINSNDPAKDYEVISNELKSYAVDLSKRKIFTVLSKADGLDDEFIEMIKDEFEKETKQDVQVVSSLTKSGLNKLLKEVLVSVKEFRDQEVEASKELDEEEGIPVITIDMEDAWEVEKYDEKNYIVKGQKIEKFAERTDTENEWGVQRLKDIMKKHGIMHDLLRKGVQVDDYIHIGDKYIQF